MSINIKPYEISVWEDELVNDVVVVETEEGTEEVPVSYYKENKIAIIGSDTLIGNNTIYNPVFSKNKNGEKKLSFSLRYKYYDSTLEAEIINPFAGYLINERKVKLYYDNEWYDFIIKEHSESKDGYEWTYSAVDAFVNELSKNGYGVTFNSDLNNNQGTAVELALKTLEDTDWEVISIDLEPPQVNEPIYKAVVKTNLQAYRMDDNTLETIEAGTKVFIFYSYIANENGRFLQFIKRTEDDVYELDDNNNITALNYRLDKDVVFNNKKIYFENNQSVPIFEYEDIFKDAQAYRVIFNQLSTYDPVMQRTVDQFKADEEIVYHYSDYTYTTSNVVVSYLTNGDNFNLYDDGSLQGWSKYASNNSTLIPELKLVSYPEVRPEVKLLSIEELHQLENYIEVKFKSNGYIGKNGSYLFNSGLNDNSHILNTVSRGEKFLLRWRAAKANSQHGDLIKTNMEGAIGAVVAPYTRELVTDPTTRKSYYQNIIDTDNILLHFDPSQREIDNKLNSIITGGKLDANHENYWIDEVIQAPSTRYIYESNGAQYVYDAHQQKFISYNSSQFMNYYYLIATAQDSMSREELANPKTRVGVFFYTTNSNYWYYLQDVQLTRYYKDGDGKPVIMGNVPTAVTTETNYYYVAPEVGTAAEKVKTYTTMEAIANALHLTVEDIIPIYNTDEIQFLDNKTAVFYVPQVTGYDLIEQFHVRGYALEKVLSIEAANSNCFDILQTIAETFECWIDLDVTHDNNGAIKLDRFGRPTKQVYLRGFSGKDNFAGFKGGINLNTIEREVDSNEIVTKLIVDDAQSDYTDSGVVSIQKASANVSKESYIFNFDYYFNQGLIANKEECEADIYDFNEKVRAINLELQEKQDLLINLENALTHISASRNVYSTLIDEAETQLNLSLDDFEDITGYTYNDYQQASAEERAELLDSELLKIDTVIDKIAEIYTCSTAINNYQGYVTNLDREYEKLRLQLEGTPEYSIAISRIKEPIFDEWMVRVVVSDYVMPFSFNLAGLTFETNVNKRVFEHVTDSVLVSNFNFKSSYKLVDEDDKIITNVIARSDQITKLRLVPINAVKGIKDDIDKLIEHKKEWIKEFYKKYSRFIQEGTWSSTDYISDDLYYLDALQLSRTSGHPKVTYNITAVDLSTIEDFESYKFDAGEKTFIEDTEFFGWTKINVGTEEEPDYVKTPARETVIISEVEWHLDDPTSNNITIQNYKTRFEDLFQRIQATVQTVQYNEATYAKTSSIIDNEGRLKESVLIDSLNNTAGREYQLTSDGSVLINGDNILVRNLTNTAQMVRIASEGLSISNDGGVTWNLALSGRGLNTNVVYAGSIDTDKIFIGGRNNPSFRWDSNGLSAFKKIGERTEENSLEPIYDFKNFVRFDQYGLYGLDLRTIDEYTTDYTVHDLEEVEENARFAVTWNGFFIRNSYTGGGKVSITSSDDIQVIDGNGQERIKIGALEWILDDVKQITPVEGVAPSLYGIRISNNQGVEVLKTDDNGDITMIGTITALEGDFRGRIHVGDINDTHILIDGGYSEEDEAYIKVPVIQSTNYEDGAGPGWKIDANGDAVFNNITARGAIKTAVFEYAEIQAVGGVFLFRPSSTIRSATIDGENIVVTVDNPTLFNTGQWCKINNYIEGGGSPDINAISRDNGLVHVYKIRKLENNLILLGAAAMLEDVGINVDSLIGGALIDLGNEQQTSNYGIGINSSDNTVDLPARAISLFETKIKNNSVKIEYDYKAVLGTLPELDYQDINSKVNLLYHNYMEGTQGIFTDNMYIGDHNQYIAFYTNGVDDNDNPQKYLDIQTATLRIGADGYLQSADYNVNGEDGFALQGTHIDLTTGNINTPAFRIDQTNKRAFLKGTIYADAGKIGGFTITDTELKTIGAYVKIFSRNRSFLYYVFDPKTESFKLQPVDKNAMDPSLFNTYYEVDYSGSLDKVVDKIANGHKQLYLKENGDYIAVDKRDYDPLLVEEYYEYIYYDPFNYEKYPFFNDHLGIPYSDGLYIGTDTFTYDMLPIIDEVISDDNKRYGTKIDSVGTIIAGGPITKMELTNSEQKVRINQQRSAPQWYLKSDGSARIGSLYLSADGELTAPKLSTITVDLGVFDQGIIKHDPVGFTNGLWISASDNINPEEHIKGSDSSGRNYSDIAIENDGVGVGMSGYRWDWRLLLDQKFGVTESGDLYATGASISNLNVYGGTYSNKVRLKVDNNGLHIYKLNSNNELVEVLSAARSTGETEDTAAATLDKLTSVEATIKDLTVKNGNTNLLTTDITNNYISIPVLKSTNLEIKDGATAILSASMSGITLSKDTTAAALTVDNLTSKGTIKYKINNTDYTLGVAGSKGITDNTRATAVTSSDSNLITARTLYYAGYTKNIGTVTGVNINGTTYSPSNGIVTLGTYLTSSDIGTAAKKDYTDQVTNVAPNASKLVTSVAVRNAIMALDDRFLFYSDLGNAFKIVSSSQNFTYDTDASKEVSVNYSAESGYTCIGLCGFNIDKVSGGTLTLMQVIAAYWNGSGMTMQMRNMGSSPITIKVVGYFLYVRNR